MTRTLLGFALALILAPSVSGCFNTCDFYQAEYYENQRNFDLDMAAEGVELDDYSMYQEDQAALRSQMAQQGCSNIPD
jgi:hypothetical protein